MRTLISTGLILLFIGCTFLSPNLNAQQESIHFRRFTDEEGLPNNLFKHVIQDKDGLIWMAGLDGLVRYDGFTIDTFRHNRLDSTSLSGNNITNLYEDTKGRLWLATLGDGLNISDRNKEKFRLVNFRTDTTTKSDRVVDITEDSLGRIWLATESGLTILNENNGRFIPASFRDISGIPPYAIAMGNAHQLFTDLEGGIWIGTSSGLYHYDVRANKLFSPRDFEGLPHTSIQDIMYDRKGKLWVTCQNKGARIFFTKNNKQFQAFNGIAIQSSTSDVKIAFDLDNRVWVSIFNDRACAFDFRDSTLFFQSKLNSEVAHERFFRKPFVDHSGNTWLPVEGFYIYPYPKGFNTYIHPYPFHQSNSCIYGSDSLLWLGYREKGLVQLNRLTGVTTHYAKEQQKNFNIPANHIQKFFKVRSGNFIIVGFGNIAVMDVRGHIVASYNVNGTQRAGFEDSKGRIWVGGYQGLQLFDEKKGVIKIYKVPSKEDSRQIVQCILEDKLGRIWFGSDIQGLSVLDPVSEKIIQYLPVEGDPNSLPSLSVLDISIDQQDILWLATDVALVRFDPHSSTFTSYGKSDGLQNDYISSVICTPDGNIWMSTHSGISSFNPAKKQFNNYGTADGLSNISYYTRGKFYDKNGTLYFGGKNGVDYFQPDKLRTNPSAPIMYLSGVTINSNLKYSLHDLDQSNGMIRLSPKDKLLQIDLVGLNYSYPDAVQYEYQMSGLSEDWIKLGRQRQVLFPALRPGNYVFRARAISDDNVRSEKDLVIPIHVAPQFYQTTWFQASAIGLVLISLFSLMKIRERNLKQKQNREAEVNRKLAELEKRALQAQMNPHFIYNSMNSIQQFMILHDIEGAMKYLTKFSRILRAVLTISSQSRIPLYDEIKLIEDYLELENMRFPNKFSYTIDVAPDINIHTVEIPPFFIQPQVENAIRHGLMRKASPGHLRIEMRSENNHLEITVEDDGIGREAARAAKYNSGQIETSKGLSIIEERLAHLNTDHTYQPFKITDLYDQHQRPAGTRVQITLPLD